MPRPSLLCLCFSDLGNDPRVHRQLRLLATQFQVTAAGCGDPRIEGVDFILLPRPQAGLAHKLRAVACLGLGAFGTYYWNLPRVRQALQRLRDLKFDYILANDSDTWPLALELAPAGRILMDAHEYAPREFDDLWWWRLFFSRYQTWLCRTFFSQAAARTTVCEGIAREYERVFGLQVEVVMNAAPRQSLVPSQTRPGLVRMLHHGVALSSRKIENMILCMDMLGDNFTLDLMLVNRDEAYFNKLRGLVATRPRVRLRPPVPLHQIPLASNDYDVGLFLLEPTNFNYRHALPNKLFEFIQARLAVAIGPSEEMARIVRDHELGVIAEDFSPAAMARALSRLDTESVSRFKRNAQKASDQLCWETEGVKLLTLFQKLTSQAPCAE